MTQEHKELLIKDICARLPYGVKFMCNKNIYTTKGLDLIVADDGDWEYAVTAKDTAPIEIDFIKPYLRPMSSMTEKEFTKLKEYGRLEYDQLDLVSFQNSTYKCLDFYLSGVPSSAVIRVFDWLNKYYFDYRDLIQMGLAIDATGLNIY